MSKKNFKSINLIRRGSGANLNLFRYAAMVFVLLMLGVGNAWAGHGGKCTAKLQVNKGTGSGSVYAATTSSATSGSSSVSADCGDSDSGTHTRTFYAFATPADGYTFLGWTESATSTAGADASNPKAVTITSESHNTVTKTLYAHFVEKAKVNITFEAPSNGTYTIAVNGGSAETVSSANVVKSNVTGVTLTATPASGYAFAGWYKLNSSGEFVEDISIASPYDAAFTKSETIKMGARFVPVTLGKFILKGSDTQYYGLKAATVAAGGSGTIVPVADETVVDGSDLMPFDDGTYTIKAGATLLVPYSSANTVQTAPVKINTTASATAISSYRKLILSDGVNIDCDGTICVGGQADAGNGGNPSGYVTGACGVIDMSKGGHIEMNNKSVLYCWGFIKGQDMDQGNNTVGAGTITANSGSVIWEDFSVGDWRGGTATSGFSGRFFPFQSYYIQNIEVPVTYKYGSTLKNFFTFNMSSSAQETAFDVIGSNTALFKLTDAQSLVRKWYDPTTDLVCYEVSGTAVLDYISLEVYITINSYDYDLPISSNMHIILTKCNLTLNRPMLVQPGGIIEIKNDANVTLATKIYMYDKDEWGPWISGKYYRSYGDAYPILTSHKNRGNGSSNADLDDATFLVDGTLTISSGAGLYSSTGGANIMGNGGGKVVFSSSLPSATSVKWYKGTKTSGDGEVGTTAMKAANLCNEDGSYTKSIASTTFHNVNGRWFAASAKDEKADHTYDFTYISSGEVSGTGGTSSTTDAVYSNDKTGIEARMKWANVTADACADWWHGQGTQAGWFYNWTMNSAWHQFQSTETEGLYSGSNNKIYTKTDCNWEELGETDVNCLYTIDGKKKALVDGHFIELEPNSDDAAFHEVADATKYYICFEGCNWHEATKIEGEKKAYAINKDNFIWYEDRWMQAEREIPFFYTYDETNVKVYYEYIGSEWVLAQPYVEVTDATETRQLLTFSEALTVASGKKNATITILRDIPNVITSGVFTGAGQTCTLDLNGHIVTSSCQNLLTVNAKSGTLTILDNTTDKKGELRACPFANARTTGFTVTAGTLVLQSGKMYSTNSATRTGSTAATYKDATNTGIVVAGTFNVTGGILESEDEHQNYGAQVSGTVNLSAGKIIAKTTKWYSTRGVYLAYGKLNISGTGALEVTAAGSDAVYGVYVHATASYNASKNTTSKSAGTLTMTGGSINAQSGKNAYAVFVNRAAAVTSSTNRNFKAEILGTMTMSGGTIEAIATSSTNARGVYSYGTVTISGGSITATAKANTTAYGILTYHGVTTIKGTANIMANATGTAYGVLASGDINGTYGYLHKSDVKIENGTIKANATTGNTAYAVYVTGTTKTVANAESAAEKVFNGDYAAAGSATITTGTFEANAKGTTAAGVFVNSEAAVTKGDASDIPTCTVNGGYYKMTGSSAVTGCNNAAAPANFQINGGYYSHDGNLATYAVSPKHVLTLAAGDANRPPFYYKVAEAYQVTFKNEDGTANIIDPIYQEVNTKPVCSTEPTKESTSTNSFTFDGWATEANGAKVYESNGLPNVTSAGATYYAHFATTTLKYRVHFDAATNGGECATENIYVNPGTAVGELPSATKYGYTFNGWFTTASGGTKLEATTVINADADYYAQFTANSHTLTWDLDGGKVSTAGKIGSTTWPAKNATGTPSTSVAYGTILTTIPVVTKTGYTFNRWDPVPTSSMPDENVTYTALWNPATNTKYYVKHYQQNIDDDNYTLVETDELTGTTDATVTPDRKSYDGFLTPTPQQLTIGAAGTSELVYNYDRVVYTINWNASANGGACATASTDVRHGATIALPAATKTGHILEGWYTKAEGGNKISDGATILQNYGTLYAQFIPTYTIIWNDENGNELRRDEKLIGESLTPPDYSKEDTQEWDYTFHGWNDGTTTYAANAIPAVSGAATYTADVTKVKNNYTLTIGVVEAGYGSVNETSVTVPYGTSVLTSDNVLTIGTTTVTATPTAKNAQYTYTFSTWQNVPTSVTGNVNNIQAVFTRTLNTVTVTWKNEDGTPLETDENVEYGATPTYDGATPIKETDENFGYTFDGWDDGTTVYAADALPIVSSAVTYTAHYSTAPTVASVKVGSNTTYYTNFADAWETVNSATDEVTLKLLGDVSGIAASLVYSGTQNCTFDLNNHTLSGTVTKLIDVNATGKTFTIDDSSAEQDGMISMIGTGNARRNALYITAGTVHLMQGKIYGKNTSTYNSSSAKAVSAAGVEIANGGQFTMDGGTVESESQYLSYALYINKSTSSVVEINRGLIKGHTNKGTTACGIYNSSTKLTINNGHIVGHAWTNTSYGLYNYYGKATINGGIIEATNDTINGKGTTKAYGISTAYSSSTYTGAITIPSNSTVKVYARANTTTAIAVVIGSGSTGSTIAGGKFTAKAGTTTAQGINSAGTITVSGGTFNVSAATTSSTITTVPCGIYATRGTVTVNDDPTFNVTSGASRAYGVFAYGTIGKKGTGKYSGTIEINGGTFNVTSTAETAWGAYAGLASRDLRSCSATNDTVPGLHYMPGILVVNDGTFNVKATTTGAFGIVVAKAKSESGTVGTTARIPLGTVTGGKFKVESMGDANATAYAMNSATTAARLVVQGGYYNTKRTDASETSNIEDKYTAPTKDCNYHVLDLPEEELPYKYKVAEAYTVTFKNGEDVLQSGLVEKNQTPEYTGTTPTKAADAQYTYTFSGWSPAITSVTGAATYTAQFGSTINQYTLTVATNNAEWGTVDGGGLYDYNSAHTITATPKAGFKFVEWDDHNTNASRNVTVTADVTYTATFDYDIANYTVKHWQQNLDNNEYTEVTADQQVLSGTIGSTTAAVAKSYTGFTVQDFSQGTIAAGSTTVVNIYYNRNTYTIEWQVDGVTKKNETVRYGATPSYGDDPTKAETAQYKYSFSGWSPTPYAADKDQTYSGSFKASAHYYTITWKNWNGEDLRSDYLQYGAQVTYGGSTPTKTDSETEHSYTFKGWSPEVVDVAGDATYTAQFDLALTIGEGEHPYVVSGEETATITTVLVQGALKVPDGNKLTTNDLIIMASADNSGDVEGVENVSVTRHAYFDYVFDVDPWHWSAFGVPFEIDLDEFAPLNVKEKTKPMVLGTDYDIVYYNTKTRAEQGPGKRNWEYVENHDHKLIPGMAYLIAFNHPVGHVDTVRFTKASLAPINYTTAVPLTVTGAKGGDNNWNGIANPKMYHALLDAGVEECQVHDSGPIGGDGYDLYTMKSGETDYKFFVGKAAFVQTPQLQSTVEIDPATNQSPLAKHNAPRRAGTFYPVNPKYDIRIAPMDGEMADRLFIRAEEGKEDDYVIVADLAKAGVSPARAQIWVDRYGYQLCKNTTALINDMATYPLGISVPQAGEYSLYMANEMAEDDNLYLTYDGRVIWNLGYAPYVLSLEKGVNEHYGLRLIHNTPAMEMDVEQVEATRAAQKMLIDQKVYILRGEQLYYITGQKAE